MCFKNISVGKKKVSFLEITSSEEKKQLREEIRLVGETNKNDLPLNRGVHRSFEAGDLWFLCTGFPVTAF